MQPCSCQKPSNNPIAGWVYDCEMSVVPSEGLGEQAEVKGSGGEAKRMG